MAAATTTTKPKRLHLKQLTAISLERLAEFSEKKGVIDLWVGPILSQLPVITMGAIGCGSCSWNKVHRLAPDEQVILQALLTELSVYIRSLTLNIHLSPSSIATLANQVLKHPDSRLELLDLTFHSELTDANVETLIQALRHNTQLRTLSLHHCPKISIKSVQCCLDCVRNDNMTLQEIDWVGTAACARKEQEQQQQQQKDNVRDEAKHVCNTAKQVFDKLEYYLSLNRAGRRLLLRPPGAIRSRISSSLCHPLLAQHGETSGSSCSSTTSSLLSPAATMEHILTILLQHNKNNDSPSDDTIATTTTTRHLDIIYYFLQETCTIWSTSCNDDTTTNKSLDVITMQKTVASSKMTTTSHGKPLQERSVLP